MISLANNSTLMNECKECPVCSSKKLQKIKKKGVNNLWATNSSDFVNLQEFTFIACSSCGLIVNNDYKGIEFHEVDYSHVFSSEQTEADYLISALVKNIVDVELSGKGKENSIQDGSKYEHEPLWIEIGSGKRVNQISDMGIINGISKFNLTDPLYKSETLREAINSNFIEKKDLFGEDPVLVLSSRNERDRLFSKNYPILIARNSLEYMSAKEIQEIFANVFKNGRGAVVLELTIPNLTSSGVTRHANLYTEYQTFLSAKSIETLFAKLDLVFIARYNALLCGEQRYVVAGTVYQKNAKKNIYGFDNLEELTRFIGNLKESNDKSRIVMVGAGARNLMYIYNEGEGVIDIVVDSSPKRIGLKIGGRAEFIHGHDQIKSDDILVILNNSIADEVQHANPFNIIATLNQIS